MSEMHGQIPLAGRKYPITQRIAKPKPPKMRRCTQCGGVFPINEFTLRSDGTGNTRRCYRCALTQHGKSKEKPKDTIRCSRCGEEKNKKYFFKGGVVCSLCRAHKIDDEDQDGMAVCTTCKQTKAVSEFGRYKDGRRHMTCMTCCEKAAYYRKRMKAAKDSAATGK